jgi:heat-inducible transcriptional repressor
LIKIASEVMSKFTHYTSMGVTPKMKSNIIKKIQVILVDNDKILLILITDTGIVKNSMVIIKEYLADDGIVKITNMLNEKYCGLSAEKVNSLSNENNTEIIPGVGRETLNRIHKAVMDCIKRVQNFEIYLEGATNILNYPEFKDVIKAQEFLNALEEKDILRKLLSYSGKNGNIKIRIGSENEIEKIKDCTLITTAYSMGEIAIGSIGIIGPTRMEYPRVISSMRYIRKKINEEIKKMIGELYD